MKITLEITEKEKEKYTKAMDKIELMLSIARLGRRRKKPEEEAIISFFHDLRIAMAKNKPIPKDLIVGVK